MRKTLMLKPESAGIAWPAVLWIAGLHAGALVAFVPACFTWCAVAVCLFLYWLTACLGICLTYHRLLTHRSFALRPRWLEYVLTAIGCCASEGGPIGWVADHRRHHAHADDEQDVHSPNRGFAWAHMLWWMTPEAPRAPPRIRLKWAPDLARDPVHRALERFHFIFPLLMFAGLYAVGRPALAGLGRLRPVVPGVCTRPGWSTPPPTSGATAPIQTRDTSTNLWWVALLAFGEGWHNNHHAFQTSARHGLRWWELDATYWAIRFMALVGLAHGLKHPKAISVPRSSNALWEGNVHRNTSNANID